MRSSLFGPSRPWLPALLRRPRIVDDPYIQYLVRSAIGYTELFRGHASKALAAAEEILSPGRKLDDPRSISWGMFSSRLSLLRPPVSLRPSNSLRSGSRWRAPFRRRDQRVQPGGGPRFAGSPGSQRATRGVQKSSPGRGALFFLAGTEDYWALVILMQGNMGAGIHLIEEAIVGR